MNAPLTEKPKYARGARVGGYTVEPSPKAWAIETGQTNDETQQHAYVLAMANQHKPWARRWLRERRRYAF
jgi:hypothetical protein